MSKLSEVRWGRLVGAVVGVLLLLKVIAFVVSKVVALTKSEMEARGSDVSFVLGMAERRPHPHGGSQ